MEHIMGSISGYTVFVVVAIIGTAWLSRIVHIATERKKTEMREMMRKMRNMG